MLWQASAGFSPLAGLGWAGVGALGLIALLYGLFVASLVSRTGQSLGKRMLGLRVLRTDSAQPSPLGESLARGLYFLLGLLGVGVLPIIQGISLARGAKDSQSWPHQLSGSQVVDIRSGPDPLNAEEVTYPQVPGEWVLAGEQAQLSTFFPRPAPAWSPAYEPQVEQRQILETMPVGSLPATPKKTWAWLAGVSQSVMTGIAVSALSAALVVSVTALQPAPPPPGDPTVFSGATLAQMKVPLSVFSGVGFPGYSGGPVWKHPVPATALTVANEAGTFVFDNRSLTILNNLDGKVIAPEALEGNVVLTQETVIGDEDGMVWQVGTTLHGWTPSRGSAPAIQAALPDGAKISAAGSSLLIQTDDGKAFTFGKSGLIPLVVPKDRLPLAVDDGKFVSARFIGPLTLSGFDGKQQSDVPLKAPGDNLQIVQWVTAGYGVVVLLWSALPGSTDPNNPVASAVLGNLNDGGETDTVIKGNCAARIRTKAELARTCRINGSGAAAPGDE